MPTLAINIVITKNRKEKLKTAKRAKNIKRNLFIMVLHTSAYIKFPGVFTHITLISNSFVYQIDVRTENITKMFYNIDKVSFFAFHRL